MQMLQIHWMQQNDDYDDFTLFFSWERHILDSWVHSDPALYQ